MSRKTTSGIDEDLDAPSAESAGAPSESDDADLHGFWKGPALDLEALDAAFADDDLDSLPDGERETLVYMGSVPQTQVDDQELMALADWAESKACRVCRTAIVEHHELPPRDHDGCAKALRAATLLRRYS
jgi:hypothetical protein